MKHIFKLMYEAFQFKTWTSINLTGFIGDIKPSQRMSFTIQSAKLAADIFVFFLFEKIGIDTLFKLSPCRRQFR